MLKSRRASFNELQPAEELLATMAAAIDTYLRASAEAGLTDSGAPSGQWRRAARAEALRA